MLFPGKNRRVYSIATRILPNKAVESERLTDPMLVFWEATWAQAASKVRIWKISGD